MTGRIFTSREIRNARISRPVSRRVFAWLSGIALAGVLIASGFIIGARRHFEAVTLGYQGEDMRRQAEQLEEQRRQLELEHSRAMSPFAIDQEAKKLRLGTPDSAAAGTDRQPRKERAKN